MKTVENLHWKLVSSLKTTLSVDMQNDVIAVQKNSNVIIHTLFECQKVVE